MVRPCEIERHVGTHEHGAWIVLKPHEIERVGTIGIDFRLLAY